MKPTRHVIVAGMTLTLAFGMTPATALAAEPSDSEVVGEADGTGFESSTEVLTSDTADGSAIATGMTPDGVAVELEAAPAPEDYDKEDYYSEEPTVAMARTLSMPLAASFVPVNVSDEMKYFSKWESHSNYDQGLSAGDGYHAMGYYQFDNRHGLGNFLISCYQYDPATYSMFSWVSGVNITGDLYDYNTGTLNAIGQRLNDSWHAAYAADPAGFSALQDSWAYQQYYLPAERYLQSIGIDISQRADCVKGLVWGMSNLFGTTGWKKFVGGVSDGYDWNGVYHYLKEGYYWPGAWNGDYARANAMSDREFVTTLCDYAIANIPVFYKGQPQYHQGWLNRYNDEKNICLSYIAQDEAQQADRLAYEANGGEGVMGATEGIVNNGVTVAQNAFVRAGYEFAGWNTAADGSGTAYAPGATYVLTSGDDVLYAQWSKVEEPEQPGVPGASDDAVIGGGSEGAGEGNVSSDGDEGNEGSNGNGASGDNGDSGSAGGNGGGSNLPNGDGSGDGNEEPSEGDQPSGDAGAAGDGSGDSAGGVTGGESNDAADSVPKPVPPSNGILGGNGATNDAPSGTPESDSSTGTAGGAEDSDAADGSEGSGNGAVNGGNDLGASNGGASDSGASEGSQAGSASGGSSSGESGKQVANAQNGGDQNEGASKAKSGGEEKETLLRTSDDSAGIVAALVAGFAMAFGVAAGTLRRILGRS